MGNGNRSLGIVLASSEVVGYAKTGGLADVCGYLPQALERLGHRVAVIMPLYRGTRKFHKELAPFGPRFYVPLRGQAVPCQLYQAKIPNSNVSIYFIEHVELFERDDPARGHTIYQMCLPDGRRQDYPDNAARFSFFCRAVMEAISHLDFAPDILHANDWQTGLIPVFLKELYQHRPAYRKIRTLFTIHNIAYQGLFKSADFPVTGLNWRIYNHHQLEFYGQWSFLKGGLVFADWISTVSPTYAQEIQTAQYGCGMEGLLQERRNRLSGIVNGVDYGTWNPAVDPHIPQQYTAETIREGKPRCKQELQHRFHLPEKPRTPILGMIARLVEQKGIDLVLDRAETLLQRDIQIIVLGDGDLKYHNRLHELKHKYHDKVGLLLGFDEILAHLIEAGSDLYLMPSQFEPSGLNQLYSLKYGTPPIVRVTGGLADSITDSNDATLRDGTATGFRFQNFTPSSYQACVDRALEYYWHRSDDFIQIAQNGMRQDWSWDRAAHEYDDLFNRMLLEKELRVSTPQLVESR
jgi:starch synthase